MDRSIIQCHFLRVRPDSVHLAARLAAELAVEQGCSKPGSAGFGSAGWASHLSRLILSRRGSEQSQRKDEKRLLRKVSLLCGRELKKLILRLPPGKNAARSGVSICRYVLARASPRAELFFCCEVRASDHKRTPISQKFWKMSENCDTL